ncbi:MAG: RNA methyltransferase [Gemmataceae bacterium]
MSKNCRVVLVRPHYAGNIGSVARVMRNFGLDQLFLIEPAADPHGEEARRLSTHGEEILDRARVVKTLEEALADCVFVAATSARTGGMYRRQTVCAPDRAAVRLLEMAARGPAALVFGPEPSGLSDEEVTRCHLLINIPVSKEYPALNLAQAVGICVYEVFRAEAQPADATDEVAPFEMQDRMFAELRRGLEEIHFLYGQSANTLMHGVRHLIGRAGPSPMETDILFGLARQLRWIAARARQDGTENDPSPKG